MNPKLPKDSLEVVTHRVEADVEIRSNASDAAFPEQGFYDSSLAFAQLVERDSGAAHVEAGASGTPGRKPSIRCRCSMPWPATRIRSS